MSYRRNVKRARSARIRNTRLGAAARQRTGMSARSGRLRAVRPQSVSNDAHVIRKVVPAIPEIAVREIHVLCVSLHGAIRPSWRLLEVPSAMTLDGLHEVLQRTFEWDDFGPHCFVTIYGELFGPLWLTSQAARQDGGPRDESGVMLAQVAGEESPGIVYLYGYDGEWRVDIRVEKVLPATGGVAYPRCTGGRGEDIPGEGYRSVSEFNAGHEPDALDIFFDYFDPEELTDDLSDLATVIVVG